jgi:hypothetical protein
MLNVSGFKFVSIESWIELVSFNGFSTNVQIKDLNLKPET